MNKNDSTAFNDVFNPICCLIKIVSKREAFQVDRVNTKKLDAVRLVEAGLGVHHAPALQAALSCVEHCCHPQLSQYSEFSFWVKVTLIGF